MKLFISILGILFSLQVFAVTDDIPYDVGRVPFHTDWCTTPAKDPYGSSASPFDQSEIEQVCSGLITIEVDMTYPAAKIQFKNGKTLTIGCVGGWRFIGEHLEARECYAASGTHDQVYVLYDQMDANGQTIQFWTQLTSKILVVGNKSEAKPSKK